jgi:hypothetical protein
MTDHRQQKANLLKCCDKLKKDVADDKSKKDKWMQWLLENDPEGYDLAQKLNPSYPTRND